MLHVHNYGDICTLHSYYMYVTTNIHIHVHVHVHTCASSKHKHITVVAYMISIIQDI